MSIRLATAAVFAVSTAGMAGAQTAAATIFSGNAPEHVKPMLGAGLYANQTDVGYYLNGGMSVANTSPYYDDLSIGAFDDPVTDQFGMGYFLNVGASLTVTDIVRLYGGVGLAGVQGVAEQFDETRILSSDGDYYVEDPGRDEFGANYNAGVLVTAGNVVIEAGYNSYFETGYLGIGFGF